MKFTKEQTEKIIKTYYKINEGEDVKVKIEAFRGCEGYYEIPYANVKITVIRMINILGTLKEVEDNLNESEVTTIFKTLLSEQGYSVKSICYDSGLTTKEYLTSSSVCAYFNGINVEVEKIVGQKVKMI